MRKSRRQSLFRSVIWRRLDLFSLEYFEFRQRADAIGLSGTIVMVDDAVPLRVEYQIRCDRSWVTQSVHVALTRGT
ncbi:MAG: putative glycolipid-binding domain-containing protein, partial [Gemmatimonadota bacterium]|nr:putative glycolipid-binding domain-containing protein [Gemmatimonadota bacterium]